MGKYIVLLAATLILAACGHHGRKKDCGGGRCENMDKKACAEKCQAMGKGHDHGKGGMMAAMPQQASATLAPLGKSKVSGVVQMAVEGNEIKVTYNLKGLKANQKHGFHIHEWGDCSSADGSSAGGHYNPMSAPHAGPADQARHAGDLGNVTADAKGVATGEVRVPGMHVHMFTGRSFMVHAGEDDLKSQPAGNSGDRVACGVIGVTR